MHLSSDLNNYPDESSAHGEFDKKTKQNKTPLTHTYACAMTEQDQVFKTDRKKEKGWG